MSECKAQAIKVINLLHSENRIEYSDYCTIYDGLDEIDTLRERDEELEELWAMLSDVPIDSETERTEEDFLCFAEGTHREDIWHWFDERYSKGVAYLMYDGEETYGKLFRLKKMCSECHETFCTYNYKGECRFALVNEHKPEIMENGRCDDVRFG